MTAHGRALLSILAAAGCGCGSSPADAPDVDAAQDAEAGRTDAGDVAAPDAGIDAAVEVDVCRLADTPSWTVLGDPASQLGNAVVALDPDGDGDDDVALGAWYWRAAEGSVTQGRAYLYEQEGGALATEPSWMVEGILDETVLSSYFGAMLSSAGDVDGDGFEDLLVAEPYSEQTDTVDARASGRVLLFPGTASGPSLTPSWTFAPEDPRQRLGTSAATAGDVDGDGYDDVIVGAHRSGIWGTGRAVLFAGSADGLSVEPTWLIEGVERRDDIGRTVGTAGDVDGDGFADVFLTSCWGDKILLYRGGDAGLSVEPSWTLYGADGACGLATSAGDANGDGYGDLAVVVLTEGTEIPFVSLYLGGADGLPPDAATSLRFDPAAFPLPGGFVRAGDVNGDGYEDLAVHSEYSSPEIRNQGMVAVYGGGPSGWTAEPIWTRLGSASSERLGTAVASVRDVDVPGCAGLVVTSSLFASPVAEMGRAEWYRPVHGADPR